DMAAAIASAEAMPQADRDAMQKMMMTMMGGAHGGMGMMQGMGGHGGMSDQASGGMTGGMKKMAGGGHSGGGGMMRAGGELRGNGMRAMAMGMAMGMGMGMGMGAHGGMSDQASGGMTGGGMNKMAAGGFTGAGGMMGGNGGGMKAMGMGDHQGKSGMMGLETTGNAEADFMRAMAVHHRSAVEMAQTVLSEDSDPEVRDLAEATIANQGAEITRIEEWLTEQGFAVPE
ncbi:hypothetical protein LCGC14_2628760, partial [marine sediment metagenome]